VSEPSSTAGAGPRPPGGAPSHWGAAPAQSAPADAPAHHRPDGRFRNPWPGAVPHGHAAALRWAIERVARGAPRDDTPPAAPVGARGPTPMPSSDTVAVTWIGHATAVLQLGGRTVISDPMFGPRASPVAWAGPRRRAAPGIAIGELPEIHAVVLSHNHYDHLDAGSVRALAGRWPQAEWHVPLRLAPAIGRLGVRRVVELDWWQAATCGPLTVTATPAQHFSGRTPFDRDRTLWCGWVIAAGERRVYFAGDTGYHPAFGEIARRLGPFDVALLPIGAYEPRWFMRPVHMSPEEAVRAFGDLQRGAGARTLVAIHWGAFKLTDEPMDEPPRRARAAWEAAARSPEALWLLRPGETRLVPR
jgi:N-acyl-phosphatidylethanolamine-hydrolysing phospholipase D